MSRRRSERCSERLNEMLSSLDSTNQSIDNVFVGGYSLRRRKPLLPRRGEGGGGREEEGGLTPARPACTPGTTRRSSKKTKNSRMTMTEPRPTLKRRNKGRGNVTSSQLSPIKDTPPPLTFDTNGDDDEGRVSNEEANGVADWEEGQDEKRVTLDHQVEGEVDSIDQEKHDTDHDSDQRIDTDDIDGDQLIGSTDSDHKADSISDRSIDQGFQKESENLEFSQKMSTNDELKSKLTEELQKMKKMKEYYERNTERFPVEGLKSVAELLKLKKKKALAVQNKKMIINKIKRKDRTPATVNSHIRKGSKLKVLLSSKDEDDSRITLAQKFRNNRLYNSSQYQRESGYYALLRRNKMQI